MHLSASLKFVSIDNYLSGVILLHKLHGYKADFRADFAVHFTLSGLRRMLAAELPARPTLHVSDLMRMYLHVNLLDQDQLAMWAALVLSFRSLLRKSNVVPSSLNLQGQGDRHFLRRSSVTFHPWGMLLSVSSTKTIQFNQRVLELPITRAPGSPLCAVFWVKRHISMCPAEPSSPFFLLRNRAGFIPLTYAKLLIYLKGLLRKSAIDPTRVGMHSLRRAGASFMHSIGLPLEDIRQAGDWTSLAALIYLTKPLQGRVDSDQRVAAALMKW